MKKGFTLIELLIVITIIGILAVAFLPSLLGAPSRARDTQRIAEVQKVAGVLTTQLVGGPSNLPPTGCVDASNVANKFGSVADYGGKLPVDPDSTNSLDLAAGDPPSACAGKYVYVKSPGGTDYSFGVYAKLENPTGNFNCANVLSDLDIISSSANQSCYAILVQ